MKLKYILVLGYITLFSQFSMSQENMESFSIYAINDFKPSDNKVFIPFYIDSVQSALAIDASQYKDKFSRATYIFSNKSGMYDVVIKTLSENDGESTYKLFVNNNQVGAVQNEPMAKNYVEQSLSFGKVKLTKGDTIDVAFNAHTNGKIPENESTAYSRGRWTKLELTPLKTQSVLRHVVLFKFKEDAPNEKIKEIEKAFNALPSKIPEIQSFEWGLNNSPEGLEKGFTHCYLLTFASETDRAIYLPHPKHKAFVNLMKPYLDDVLVVDYWSKEN